MKPLIFVALSTFAEFDPRPLEILKKSGFDYSINQLGRRLKAEEIIKLASSAVGIVAGVEPYTREVLEKLPELKCISRCGVGIDSIDLQSAKDRGIAVKNTPDAVVQPVAELTIAMIFDLLRKLTEQTLLLKAGNWKKLSGNLLAGRKIGVIGLGRIGKKVAEMLIALGAKVIATDISPDREWIKRNKVTLLSIKELLSQSDVVTIHVCVSQDNPFVIGKNEIAMMKPGALLINTSRGSLLNEGDLYEALKSGCLAGAALDVFAEEPYNGALRELNNVVLTPHIATLTAESRTQMEIEAIKSLLEFLSNQR